MIAIAMIADHLPPPAAKARLLLHLADGRLLKGLAGEELALGEAPIVVPRAMDQHHLEVAAWAGSPHHRPRGFDL